MLTGDEDHGYEQVKRGLKEWLAGAKKLMVLGVGNELRGEDAAGLLVARALNRFNCKGFEAVECGVLVEACINYAFEKKPSHLLIVDSFPNGFKTVLLDLSDLGPYRPISTHAIPLPLLIETLGKPVGVSIKLLGIGVKNFGFGATISPRCAETISKIAEVIREVAAGFGLL